MTSKTSKTNTKATTDFEREIREQPECLARLLSTRPAFESVARAIRAFAPRFVVTVARGSSDNAARYAKYLFGARNRLVVSLGAPSLLTLYGSAPDLQGALVIGISQSGASPDITALLREAQRQGACTLALTNTPNSPLAKAATHVLPLGVGREHSVAATKSYTAQLLALAMLSASLSGEPSDWAAIGAVPQAVEETIRQNPTTQVATLAAEFVETTRMLVVGRGFNFCTAFEIGLKLKETAYISAESYATPDLMHGPIAVVDTTVPAILLAAQGPTLAELIPLAEELRARQCPIVIVSNQESAFRDLTPREHILTFSNGIAEWLSPIAAVVPGQLFASAVASARNLNPDFPRGLAKITKTR